MKTKAISPLIATVLLIGIVIAASTMVYVWSRGFIAEEIKKFGESIDVACNKVAYDVHISAKGGKIFELVISNHGNVGINEINIKAIQGGKSVIKALSQLSPEGSPIVIGMGETATISLNLDEFGLDFFDSVDVTPVLLGKGEKSGRTKLYACKEQAKTGLEAEVVGY